MILICNRPDGKASFHRLLEQRAEIESELQVPLEWEELPEQRRSLIQLRRDNTDPARRDQWPEQHAWLVERTIAFYRTFSRRLRALDLGRYGPDGEADEVSDG